VFTLIVHTFNKTTNQKTMAKISFVDLAGSERINKSNTNIKQLQEAIKINKSLTALKDVIRALSQGTSSQFVPYRNNKLTELMRDSIGGNSKTLMFVNISPADYNSQESQMSLFFGCDAKQIKNDIHKNVETQEMAKLKEQIDQLKKMLHSTQK
jgi:3-polyprenyl-4-hydroxybenzoate decarboxylase